VADDSSQAIITFEPDGKAITAAQGERLLDVATRADVAIPSECGGQGTCGRCEVILHDGVAWDVQAEEQVAAGPGTPLRVLACQTTVVGDLRVEVPTAPRRRGLVVLTAAPLPDRVQQTFLEAEPPAALARRCRVSLSLPSKTDSLPDLSRLARALEASCAGPARFDISLPVLRKLPGLLRANDFSLDVTVADAGTHHHIAELGPPSQGGTVGAAVDLGTSTVVVYLIDLHEQTGIAIEASHNAQRRYGDDVISRIAWAEEHPQGTATLQQVALDTINGLIERAAASQGMQTSDIIAVTCAGNTTMMNYFLGIPAGPVRKTPHVPPAGAAPVYSAQTIGVEVAPYAPVYVSPAIAGFVGGDISAGILATGMAMSEETSVLVDLGTNGEVVVGNRDWMVCASCSAGPAFEGVGIRDATFAVRGAVQGYDYDAQTDTATVATIEDAPPVGICGSGMIEALASLVENEVIDRAGQIQMDFPSDRVRETDEETEVVLIRQGEAGAERDICLRQPDIENLIRSKAAVYAGLSILLRNLGLTTDDVQHIYLAGGFGNSLKVERAVAIGMLPDLPLERIHFVGNSSLAGASLALLSRRARDELVRIAEATTYQELAVEAAFADEFIASMFLPHTDISRFPSVVA